MIEIGNSLGINHLYNVTDIFFEFDRSINCHKNATNNGTYVNPYILSPNYETNWQNMLPIFNELYYINESIFGFFIGDELISHGTVEMPSYINTAAKTIRESFNDSIIYMNGGHSPISKQRNTCGPVNFTKISPYLDWFSIDMYHTDHPNATYVDSIKLFYEQYVFPAMDLSYQSALAIPGSFTSDKNDQCDYQCYDELCNEDAINFYFWGINDERIIGLYPLIHGIGKISIQDGSKLSIIMMKLERLI